MAAAVVTTSSLGIGISMIQNIVPGLSDSSQGFDGLTKDIESVCKGRLGRDRVSVKGEIRLSQNEKIEFENNVVNMTEDTSDRLTRRVGCPVDTAGITEFSGRERFDYTIESRYSDSGVTYKVFE